MSKKYIFILLHSFFWVFNVFVNILFTDQPLLAQTASTLIFALPFYINYYLLVPSILSRINTTRILLWFFSYIVLHFSVCYPLYEFLPGLFKTPGIVKSANNIGATIHLSFYYLSISTASRLVIEWVKNTKRAHRLYLKKADQEIESLKSEMSFPFVKGVLEKLEEEAVIEPNSVVKPMSSLAKVLRFKLYRKKNESIMLSDEVKIIENYLQLLSKYKNSRWLINIRGDQWIETGLAFLRVEQCLSQTDKTTGVIELYVVDDDVKIEVLDL